MGKRLSILALVTCLSVLAQESDKLLVSLSVSSSDQTLHDRILSALDQEFRKLEDVKVFYGQEYAFYALDVLAIASSNKSNVNTGFVLGVTFSAIIPTWAVKAACKEGKLSFLTLPSLRRVPDDPINSRVILNTLLREDSPEEVEHEVRDLVAKFNSDILIPERQFQSILKDQNSKAKPKSK